MKPLNPCELEIDLFCKGIRIDASCALSEDGRFFSRTRAGLGSGLELVIPAPGKDIWLNVPVEEDFVALTPYRLVKWGASYFVRDDRDATLSYPVTVPGQPAWYEQDTSKGTPMSKVGVLQGTYLGIYISNSCSYWYTSPSQACKFCTTGLNVGVNEVAVKDVDDVVETALAAKRESGVTFVHFNSGYQPAGKGLDEAAPYVKAVKERVGALVGVQVTPSKELWKYDWLMDLGTDHFSFCYEFHNPDVLRQAPPGQAGHHRPARLLRRHGVLRPARWAPAGTRGRSSRAWSPSRTRSRPSTTSSPWGASRRCASSGPSSGPRWSSTPPRPTRTWWWSCATCTKRA